MNSTLTVGDLVEFVLHNRKGRAFLNYPSEEIALEIQNSANDGSLRFATDCQTGELVGVACNIAYPDKKVLYVKQLICNKPWVLKSFIGEFCKSYPGWSIQGSSSNGNRVIHYNTEKLIRRIMNHG